MTDSDEGRAPSWRLSIHDDMNFGDDPPQDACGCLAPQLMTADSSCAGTAPCYPSTACLSLGAARRRDSTELYDDSSKTNPLNEISSPGDLGSAVGWMAQAGRAPRSSSGGVHTMRCRLLLPKLQQVRQHAQARGTSLRTGTAPDQGAAGSPANSVVEKKGPGLDQQW
ncbi:unnamed protein product [Clonostachys chloroleuca]|uniref:Uncharacterized protein n=1 Tax=Clonostachys chloroleuca TaxID=1926264 RepID=A0AA35LSG8_9HYPO|nr:unnamed protein product [Clonostachys chloroleuca]